MFINELDPDDIRLFDEMSRNYTSENERIFFERMKEKELYSQATSNEVLLTEKDNDDYVFIVRNNFDSYIVGSRRPGRETRAFGTETLSFILTFDMTMDDVLDRHITFGEWLRERDYVGINYDYNCDD